MKIVRTVCCVSTLLIFVRGVPLGEENELQNEIHEGQRASEESRGYFQSITDTVKEYTVNKVLNMFKTMPVECKSKINKSGKLIATKNGKKFCEKTCLEIYEKIDNAKKTINAIKSYLPFAQTLELKPRRHQNSRVFKCARNLTGTKLICDCPQAPQFNFGKSLKNYLEKTFLKPSAAARDKHKYYYPPPYYGYGYNNGPFGSYGSYGHHGHPWGYGFNPLGELFSMIFAPLKILFFIVTLPFWIFLLVFLGMELDDIFD
ncbi:uncharacterized protein LOC135832034 [Planococcus citri]|uniref:uncharacterized protein LOC135832034 n=1 Tax=Planococcus citri TaxID=170843 RepID=UPI0031F919B5